LRLFGRPCLDTIATAGLLIDEAVIEGRESLAQTTQLVLETLDLVGLESWRRDTVCALCIALVAVSVAHERDHDVALIETGTHGTGARIVFVLIAIRDGRCDDNDLFLFLFFHFDEILLHGDLSAADLLALALVLAVGALCRLGALLLASFCGPFGDPLATRVAAFVLVSVALKLVVVVVVVKLVSGQVLARPLFPLQTALTALASRVLLGPDGLGRASGARGGRQTQLRLARLVARAGACRVSATCGRDGQRRWARKEMRGRRTSVKCLESGRSIRSCAGSARSVNHSRTNQLAFARAYLSFPMADREVCVCVALDAMK